MSTKANVIKTDGEIVREDGNGYFRVELDQARRSHLPVPSIG